MHLTLPRIVPENRSANPRQSMAAAVPPPPARPNGRLSILLDALLAACDGDWDRAEQALARDPDVARRDAACLNLRGIVCQARGQWKPAQRFYGKSRRADRAYIPAEQNLRRC